MGSNVEIKSSRTNEDIDCSFVAGNISPYITVTGFFEFNNVSLIKTNEARRK